MLELSNRELKATMIKTLRTLMGEADNTQMNNAGRKAKPPKESEVAQLCLFATPWTAAYQAPLSMGFSRQEYWSGLPFPSPGDLPHPGLSHCRQMLYRLSQQGSKKKSLKKVSKGHA